MGDFRIGTATSEPAAGTLKVGSADVQEIYLGSTKVWPTVAPLPPGQVEICNLIWTDTNSSETELIAGGNLPILTNQTDWYNAWQAQTPAACYWNFDSNNASYGLLYNLWAKDAIKTPTGFRLPLMADFNVLKNAPCYTDTGGGYNRYGKDPGNWDPSSLTNTSELGNSGLNIQGYGYASLNTNLQSLSFQANGIAEAHWADQPTIGAVDGFIHYILNGVLAVASQSPNTKNSYFIRFVKDA
jgi:uncharacterized protein (TIGR02145 family)